MPWVPWPTPTPGRKQGPSGSHRDNTVDSCPLCQMMAALIALPGAWPDDDEPFGYPRCTDEPPPPMATEPPLDLEPDILPQVFE